RRELPPIAAFRIEDCHSIGLSPVLSPELADRHRPHASRLTEKLGRACDGVRAGVASPPFLFGSQLRTGNDFCKIQRKQSALFASSRQTQKGSKRNHHDCHHGEISHKWFELGYHADASDPRESSTKCDAGAVLPSR